MAGEKGTKLDIVSKVWPVAIQKAKCESPKKSSDELMIKRADSEELRHVFEKYASQVVQGEKYMSYSEFVLNYLQLLDADKYDEYTHKVFASCVDTSRDGLISFSEFQGFEALLCAPDAMYALAFQIFDRNGNGYITYDEFQDIIKHTTLHQFIPFDFDSEFIKLHFGKDKSRKVTYTDFTQLIHDFHEEHAWQAFRRRDKNNCGYISAKDFEEILLCLKSYLLSPFVKENIVSVILGEGHQRQISYAYYTAFISLLNNMELCKRIYLSATRRDETQPLSKEEFLYQSQEFSQITPLEVDILYQLVYLQNQQSRPLYKRADVNVQMTFSDLSKLSPMEDRETPFKIQLQIAEQKLRLEQGQTKRTVFLQAAESAYRFALGALAGATGATAVYPIDLVKTRLQNQRSTSFVGELMYKNSFDCFRKVIRHEGVLGLYRGLAPQLVGVAPEKAIKLTMNDLMRDKLLQKDGTLPLWAEMVAGGTAGASQVVFTNPLEIVKIRLQVAGEIVGKARVSAISVIKELGFFGLYKGSKACFLRDIPFSAIYFPAYAHNKKYFADENGYNSPGSLLLSATLAGMPAAFFPTPADVIKTRLQVQARKGQTTYKGVIDCARKIYAEEGMGAFWKGGPARVFRSSPQFGVTLLTYELLQRLFYVDFGGSRPEGSEAKSVHLQDVLSRNPDHIGGYRMALATFDGIETKFGLMLPKFRPSTPSAEAAQ
ncbi:electrogenic aspartate/glutamate antiporter SLC25A13, mitochondrial-like isoform X2 [Biomphalaria glabrata]|uniref:Electrogenic aspartate/glutamate antiporter SLC25A13, mitochondrial-like isoform X2 n=1 Tax=Biomphalaria glabrata TaxID=6526 RepID=A0A9W2YAG6_BIOGL|nr:electrogenic aspartate/glutamate antiporter SLC25A13, mitochondrial-like isoform X2 [Biomphalaria glabrata]